MLRGIVDNDTGFNNGVVEGMEEKKRKNVGSVFPLVLEALVRNFVEKGTKLMKLLVYQDKRKERKYESGARMMQV